MIAAVAGRPILVLLLILAAVTGCWWWLGGSDSRIANQESVSNGTKGEGTRLTGNNGAKSTASDGILAPRSPGTGPVHAAEESAAAREESLLISRLRHQGVGLDAGDKLHREEWVLYPELLNLLSDSSNWMAELMKATSSVQSRGDGRPTRLSLDRMEADSILWQLGLREGDVILLIDGAIPEFSPTKALDYIRQADAALAALDRGEAISLTVLRQQRPLHLVYRFW